jgi:hypothetical protein
MSEPTVILLWSVVCPWLLLVLAAQGLVGLCGLKARGWPRLSVLGLVAAGLLLVPVQGMPIAGWVRGLNANFSLPFTGLIAIAVWEGEFRHKLFSKADWSAAWAFGAVAGLALYPFALGWGRFDPYEWGWQFSPLFAAGAVLTALLLWKRNRFGLLLLLAIAAYNLRLLESANYWDYLLDPVYCLVSLAGLCWQLIARARQAPAAPSA